MYQTIGIETHSYAPELNKLHLADGFERVVFNCPNITDIREAEDYVVLKHKITIVGIKS